MKLYKITRNIDGRYFTRNEMEWFPDRVNKAEPNIKNKHQDWLNLCSSDVLHAYLTVGQALCFREFHNLQHLLHSADWKENLILWEAEGEPVIYAYDKVGVKELKLLKQIPWPEVSDEKVFDVRNQYIHDGFLYSFMCLKEEYENTLKTMSKKDAFIKMAKELDEKILKQSS